MGKSSFYGSEPDSMDELLATLDQPLSAEFTTCDDPRRVSRVFAKLAVKTGRGTP